MACKDDSNWFETASAVKDNCITWGYLLTLRFIYNDIWDLLKIEDRQEEFKYGYTDDEEDGQREQIEGLADIKGYFSVRFNSSGDYDEIFFRINGGTILERISDIEGKYRYNYGVNTEKFSPWIAWLKDPCFGCTVFQYDNRDVPYPRGITCNGDIFDIDDSESNDFNAKCIWTESGCDSIDYDKAMEDGLCHIDIDWKKNNGNNNDTQQKLGETAKNLFPHTICVDLDNDPGCHYLITWCCSQGAFGHYTEGTEWTNQPPVFCVDPDPENSGWIERKLKWVSLGIGDVSGIDSPQPRSWDDYLFRNSFQGYVTQIIRAVHLTDMIDKLKKALDGKKNRQCSQKKCGWDENTNISEVWINDEGINFDDIKKRLKTEGGGPSACDKCDKPATSSAICACEWNDLELLMKEYRDSACTCLEGSTYADEKCIGMGDLEDCNCCKTRCCCNCECIEDVTKAECEKLGEDGKCKYGGPTWVGIYEKGESKDDKKIGKAQPCGCFEEGDPKFPDKTCKADCGELAACCSPGQPRDLLTGEITDPSWKCSCKDHPACNCCCVELTKCECKARGGVWKGLDDKGKGKDCYSICFEGDCTESCCQGTWSFYENGCAGQGGFGYGDGVYCNGCFVGLQCSFTPPYYDYEGCMKLDKTICGNTTNVGSWTVKEGAPVIDLSSYCCPGGNVQASGTGGVNSGGF
jgi:hypothetical protein